MAKAIRKPDWTTWLHVQHVSLWEGVLLSLDVEPADHDYDARQLEVDAQRSVALKTNTWSDAAKRLMVARRNVCEGGRLKDSLYAASADTQVLLLKFVSWAESVKWELPAQLAALMESTGQPALSKRWPWGDYETKPLSVLAEAVYDLWSTFDPDQPETAPKQSDVTAFIEKRLAEVGYVNPGAIASAMATIIRHEKAPTGRRRKTER